jgi:hypothetical protein
VTGGHVMLLRWWIQGGYDGLSIWAEVEEQGNVVLLFL